jgi:hypothetical protein
MLKFSCLSDLLLAFAVGAASLASAEGPPRISEDRELREINLTGWDCLNRLEGTAKTPDGIQRNSMKSRPPIDLAGLRVEQLDCAAFLKHVGDFDQQTKGKHRKDLSLVQRQQLNALEKEIVSLDGWLILAYAGPPETTNCGSTDFHDWHLEIYASPQDHPPEIGDPTGIICEITPRTQNMIYLDHIRLQQFTGFFRRPDLTIERASHPARKIRLTGYLMWDDEHNGSADVGTTIRMIAANKYHQPWRATAWEIHPVIKIEAVNETTALDKMVKPTPSLSPAVPPVTAASPMLSSFVTITKPVRIKIHYGETLLPAGMKLPVAWHDADHVGVKYMDEIQTIPISSTDLYHTQ